MATNIPKNYGGKEQKNHIFNWGTEDGRFYHANGNYYAFARPPKPEGIEDKKAIVVGAGIAGLAAACFLVRDAQMPGENITIMELRSVSGGSCDGKKLPGLGYVISGGREMDDHFECFWDLFHSIPSIDDPNESVLSAYYRLNNEDPSYSNCRVIEKQGQDAHTDKKFGLSDKALMDIMKLTVTRDDALYGKAIKDIWGDEILGSNFWTYFRTMFAFKDEHSALEVKRYMQRYIHHVEGFPDLSALRFCKYNNYESLILPMENYLKERGVKFMYHSVVDNVLFEKKNGEKTAKTILWHENGKTETKQIDIDKNTLVFFTNGSNTTNLKLGDMDTVPEFDTTVKGSWKTWQNIAKQDPDFGHPDEFLKEPELTYWESATLTTLDNRILPYIQKITGRDPRDGKAVTGGICTIRDSGWLMSFTINRQRHFREQDEQKNTVVWIYGLYPSRTGNYIKKPMRDCNGKEIAAEWLYHIGVPEELIPELSSKKCVNCIPCMMPRVDTYFICRHEGDRPRVVPHGVTNFAFLGNHAEVDRDTCFTTEMSIRTAMEGVYALCNVDRAVPEVYGSIYDIRWLLNSAIVLRDYRPLNDFKLPVPKVLEKPVALLQKPIMNKILKKLNETDLGVLLKRLKVFDFGNLK